MRKEFFNNRQLRTIIVEQRRKKGSSPMTGMGSNGTLRAKKVSIQHQQNPEASRMKTQTTFAPAFLAKDVSALRDLPEREIAPKAKELLNSTISSAAASG